jgi:hypothetical protein
MTEHLSDAALMVKPTEQIGRLRSRSLLLPGIGLAAAVAGFAIAGDDFWPSYLIAYIFWLGITLGSLAVLMVHHLSGGAWGMVGRRVWEASTRTLPLMALLFIPIFWKLPVLYSWARPEAANDHIIHEKAAYLNAGFFGIRAIVYFALWGGLIFFLTKWSKEQDAQPVELPGAKDRRSRVLSGPGLVIYVLTITFMSVDWVMSLDPHWYSTIFGILTIGQQGLSALAFTIVVVAALARFRPMSDVAGPDAFHDLAKLMLAFVMLWAYFNVSQLLIIWSANLPEEIPFYLERLHGAWAPVSIALLLGQFVLPFLLLLSRDLKRSPSKVRWIAMIILFMRIVDLAWTVGPVFRHEGSSLSWIDFAAVLGMGAPWLFLFWSNLAGRSVVPAHDPYFKEAMAHGGH